jgi:hypothetical protein
MPGIPRNTVKDRGLSGYKPPQSGEGPLMPRAGEGFIPVFYGLLVPYCPGVQVRPDRCLYSLAAYTKTIIKPMRI